MVSRFPIFIAVAAAVVVFAGPPTAAPVLAQANDVFAYPLAGQGQEQQSRDRFDCHQWAVQQSGFDPFAAPPPPQQTQQQGGGTILGLGRGGLFPGTGMVGDAATGAGLGAAGGAIAGSPGKGAAIGAVGGAVLGGLSRAGQPSQTTPSQSEQVYYQRRASYNNAFGACMQARNYSVRF
jgi:hypothetical protein